MVERDAPAVQVGEQAVGGGQLAAGGQGFGVQDGLAQRMQHAGAVGGQDLVDVAA